MVARSNVILRTDRQIYMTRLRRYSTQVSWLHVRPGDVMGSDSWNGDRGYQGERFGRSYRLQLGVWKFHWGTWIQRGLNSMALWSHLSSQKFGKVAFIADFSFWPTGMYEYYGQALFVDDNFNTSREDEDDFVACVHGKGSNRSSVLDVV